MHFTISMTAAANSAAVTKYENAFLKKYLKIWGTTF